jgi:hypothetical protein
MMPRHGWNVVAALGLFVAVGGAESGEPLEPSAPVVSCEAAGPPPVAWWAVAGRTPAYTGCYVGGGGNRCRAESRAIDEGTWGWDYQGYCNLRKIWLSWNHGRLDQGGQGAYRTDGHPVCNILANPPTTESGKDH